MRRMKDSQRRAMFAKLNSGCPKSYSYEHAYESHGDNKIKCKICKHVELVKIPDDKEHPARKLNREGGVDVKMIEKHDPNYYRPDIKAAERKKFIQEHERMLLMSKAKAYSNLSLQRPLTDSEFKEYKKVMSELQK